MHCAQSVALSKCGVLTFVGAFAKKDKYYFYGIYGRIKRS